jgi:hypothetical protein
MRERLKRAVLKTVVPERVPGVRIPLPPPYSLEVQRNLPGLSGNNNKSPQFCGFSLTNRTGGNGLLGSEGVPTSSDSIGSARMLFAVITVPAAEVAINHTAPFRTGTSDLTMARMSRFSNTKPWRSCVRRSTTSTIAHAKSSARTTWFGNSTRNTG